MISAKVSLAKCRMSYLKVLTVVEYGGIRLQQCYAGADVCNATSWIVQHSIVNYGWLGKCMSASVIKRVNGVSMRRGVLAEQLVCCHAHAMVVFQIMHM